VTRPVKNVVLGRHFDIKTKEKSYKYNIFNYGEVKKLREMFMSVIPNKVK